ncbi:hypothetical protein THARTR1_03507 [Trichoderma harzianum]|uniref:Fucose-specific lectin n=1 Tax=Trichoderma harzianum TaxID=5544 RepID=A0A2K0UEY1_TRIHA|nr:hypothetical protein THARTR1_03507 [Trichoderma harzianum]
MSAVSAVINPVTADRPSSVGDKRVLIFSASSKYSTVSFEQRKLRTAEKTPRRHDGMSGGPLSQKVKNPSSLVTINYDDAAFVYGVTMHTPPKSGETQPEPIAVLSLFHPVHQHVAKDDEGNKIVVPNGFIAGCTDNEHLWIYYQTYVSLVNVIIKRSEVSGSTANITNLSVEHVLEKTWLGAFFDGKSQWVVFQSDNNRLTIFNANKGKDSDIDSDGKKFLSYTPIACAFVPSKSIDPSKVPSFKPDADVLGRAFVYYLYNTNGNNILHRRYADIEEKKYAPDWQGPIEAGNGPQAVQATAQMSVVVDHEQQCNWIYTLMEESDTVSAIRDNWAADSNEGK